MLRSTKSDMDFEEVDPLIFSKKSVVTGTRRRLTSRSPIERSARISGSSPVSYAVVKDKDHNMLKDNHHIEPFSDQQAIQEPLNAINLLRHGVDSSGTSSFRSIPSLAESFVADTEYYRTYYNTERNSIITERRLNADKAGRFCAIFSLVGMLFLVRNVLIPNGGNVMSIRILY